MSNGNLFLDINRVGINFSDFWEQFLFIAGTLSLSTGVPPYEWCHRGQVNNSSQETTVYSCTNVFCCLVIILLSPERINRLSLGIHTHTHTHTHTLCMSVLKLCAAVQDVHQRWPLWKNSFDSAAVICQGQGSYLQLSLAYVTMKAMLHFSPLAWKHKMFPNVSRALFDFSLICFSLLLLLLFKDHHWGALFGWLTMMDWGH